MTDESPSETLLRKALDEIERLRKIDFFGIARNSIEVGAPGIKPVIRDAIARNIAFRADAALNPKDSNDD